MITRQTESYDDRIGKPDVWVRPDGWVRTRSWRRAVQQTKQINPITKAEFIVKLSNPYSDSQASYHRVTFIIDGGELRSHCDCQTTRPFCAHTASLWWRWVRGNLFVHEWDTGRNYQSPPPWLSVRGGSPW